MRKKNNQNKNSAIRIKSLVFTKITIVFLWNEKYVSIVCENSSHTDAEIFNQT